MTDDRDEIEQDEADFIFGDYDEESESWFDDIPPEPELWDRE